MANSRMKDNLGNDASPASLAGADSRASEMTDRCVNCSRTKDQHLGENLDCPGSGKTRYGTMNLPAGRTCNDCAHLKTHCCWLLSRDGTEKDCDWFPIRFVSLPGLSALLNGDEVVKGGSGGSL